MANASMKALYTTVDSRRQNYIYSKDTKNELGTK